MTTVAPPTLESAREVVAIPDPPRGSAKEARAALDELTAAAGPGSPFDLESVAKRRRPGGHKPTKREIEARATAAEARTRELETALARATGQPTPALAEAEAQLRPALAGTFDAVFRMAASARGDFWQLDEGERDQLAAAWAPVLVPHMGGTAEYLPWVVAAGVTYAVVEPRVRKEQGRRPRELVLATGGAAHRPATRAPSSPPASPAAEFTEDPPPGGERPLDPPAPIPPAPHTPGDSFSDHPGYPPGRAI